MRWWSAGCAAALGVILYLGQAGRPPPALQAGASPPGASNPRLPLDCDTPGRNDLACGQKYCQETLVKRGLLPHRVPILRWETRPATVDLVQVTLFTGEYAAGGARRYVQCAMVGRVPMSVQALATNPFP